MKNKFWRPNRPTSRASLCIYRKVTMQTALQPAAMLPTAPTNGVEDATRMQMQASPEIRLGGRGEAMTEAMEEQTRQMLRLTSK